MKKISRFWSAFLLVFRFAILQNSALKPSITSLAVLTSALLAWPVLSAVPAQAEGNKKPKNEEAARKADPEKKKKREEERAKKKMAANPEKKPAEPKKKPEVAKKPEPEKKPAEPAKKPEVAKKPEPPKPTPATAVAAAEPKGTPAPAAGSAVATVIYDKGSGANLKGRDEALEKVRAALKQNPGAKFSITGHADDTPYPVANQEISENRAKFLAAYLRTNGIPKDRVESRGVGNTQAVKGQPNRRAVIELKK